MKSFEKMLGKLAKDLATKSIFNNANSTTSVFTYQPIVPAELKKFIK